MALSFQHPPIKVAPALLTYRVTIDALTSPGVGTQYHMNAIAGDLFPGMLADSIIGPLQDYFNNLMSTYFPGDMFGMLNAVTSGAGVGVYVTGPGAPILAVPQWGLDTVGLNTALSLQVDVSVISGTAPTYVDITIFANVAVKDPITEVTTLGSILEARREIGDLAFAPTHFAIGNYGFDPLIPQYPLPVDPDSTSLVHELYRSPIERFDAPNDYTLAVVCRIPASTLRSAIGEVGVFVTLTAVNKNTPLVTGGPTLSVGDIFLFGLTHTAMRCVSYDQADLHVMTFAL